MLSRPRRNRKSPVLRAAHRETHLGACNFCLPLFIHESEEVVPVESMPGCSRLSLAALVEEVAGAIEDGIGMVEVRGRGPLAGMVCVGVCLGVCVCACVCAFLERVGDMWVGRPHLLLLPSSLLLCTNTAWDAKHTHTH
jgi:hypothetical protein